MLYIRTDMNNKIATGHVMRCLAIADAARELNEDTTFILADRQAEDFIKEKGFHTIILGTEWDNMDQEIGFLLEVVNKENIKGILIDSYMVTRHYLETLSEHIKTAYIDDLGTFFYPVHMLVCYAIYWESLGYIEHYKKTKLLLGTKYAPLRKVFQNCTKKEVKEKIENVLLLSGGTDRYQILEGILEEIERGRYKRIDVVCGRYYKDYKVLCRKYQAEKNIYIHKAVDNIEEYMKQADMAISAGGMTLYELCACGTPAISYSFADNQLENVLQFQKEGLMEYAGDIRTTNIYKKIASILEKYNQDFALRKECSNKMQDLLDGNGAKRIAEEFILFFQ
ncbi:MAG: UDP-2,4-diacetamido-2,4,6-trideoxy-beta-L-altropyranose hydrolase [Lachnospiraceae bacterium]|nr:UDP-2,4-diacetamido-2,4,6-trideoxy-beta-L-altropyranose hydrolase [Lachnospiraceae bacterium]